jgi:ribosomal protein S17E
MTVKQNLTFLKSYSSIAKTDVRPKVAKVIQLYQDRLIRNFETAKNVLDKLTSSNKNTVKSGLSAYDKTMVKYEHSAPVGKPVKLKVLGRPNKKNIAASSKIGKHWKNSIILKTEVVASAFKNNVMQVNVKETTANKSMYRRVAMEAIIYKAYQAAIKKLPPNANFKFHAVLRVNGAQDGNFTVRGRTHEKYQFLYWFNELVEKIKTHFQSYKTLEETTFDIDFFFTVIPSGAGHAGHATEDRSLASIYAKKSVIKINNDDNSCFWHALAVLLNKDHEDYKNIRQGRLIRTELAQELCDRCSMNWNEQVSIGSFEKIESN